MAKNHHFSMLPTRFNSSKSMQGNKPCVYGIRVNTQTEGKPRNEAECPTANS